MSRSSQRPARALAVLVALTAVVTAVSAASAARSSSSHHPAAVVKGGGKGVLTDPDGNSFRLGHFRVRGVVADHGSAWGTIRFVWRGSFPEVWGDPVCAGTCDTITLTGKVESGSVASDGTVTLSGTAREIDKRRGRVIFDSGFDEPFSIVAGGSQGDDEFILQWCLLPEFQIEGSIRVRVDDDRATASSLNEAASPSRAPCSR